MSAFRRAVLSVAPERLEQFSMEMEKNIKQKPKSKRKSMDEKSSKTKRRRKHSSHGSETRKSSKSTSEKIESGKKRSSDVKKGSSHSRSRDRGRDGGTSSKERKSKKVKSKNYVDDSDFDPKDLDLSTPLAPLSDLVKDRIVLLDTVFSIIKGPKLTSMLPDILKLMPLEEIKRLCGEQLDVMSSKRILHIIFGREMVSSSGTDSSDNEVDNKKTNELSIPVPLKHDLSLQANFIDSTTSDQPSSGPSMLFPSALSTAQAAMANSNDMGEENINNASPGTVSTSTEPNIIYTEVDDDGVDHVSSDTEEGEVQTSDEEHEVVEHDDDVIVIQDEEVEDHPAEGDVFVEVEELEELLEEDFNNKQEIIRNQPNKNKRKVSVKKIHKEEIITIDGEKSSTTREGTFKLLDEEVEISKKSSSSVQGTSSSGEARQTSGEVEQDEKDPNAGKSQLEILELELRERAIRSLMKAVQTGKLKPATK